MILRDYQLDLCRRILEARAASPRVMGQLPTGGGKSACMGELARLDIAAGYRPVFVAHRRFLIEQIGQTLRRFGVLGQCTLSTVQGSSGMDLSGRYGRPASLYVDEAHHATARTYRRLIEQAALVTGFTATPWRLSLKEGFDDMFGALVCGPTQAELVRMGYLVRAEPYILPANFGNVRIIRGEYDAKELAEIVMAEGQVEKIARAYLQCRQYAPGGSGPRAIIYCVSVRHAQAVAAALQTSGVSSVAVDGKTQDFKRRAAMYGFEHGRYEVLVNCDLITEGLDVPACNIIMLAKPTKSLALYLQMTGRGARPEGGKDRYVLIDCAGGIAEHGMPEDERQWSLAKRAEEPAPVIGAMPSENDSAFPEGLGLGELPPCLDKLCAIKLREAYGARRQVRGMDLLDALAARCTRETAAAISMQSIQLRARKPVGKHIIDWLAATGKLDPASIEMTRRVCDYKPWWTFFQMKDRPGFGEAAQVVADALAGRA